jgi:CTP synthase (UTP-ammonia lyase)
MIKIGVIGDYDGRPSHIATNEAIKHCALYLGLRQETQWISTDSIENGSGQSLNGFDALWCAPGSPYKSAQGAMNAIQFARENNYPFMGTCGGFQHVVLEFARDVLHLSEIKSVDFNPYTPNLFISALSCSLIGETRTIFLTKDTKVAQMYGAKQLEERYNCNFGLNDQFRNQLVQHGFVVAGTDETGNTRILELLQNKFFIATLFQPQLSSTPENPHKLILAYLKSAEEFSKRTLDAKFKENLKKEK